MNRSGDAILPHAANDRERVIELPRDRRILVRGGHWMTEFPGQRDQERPVTAWTCVEWFSDGVEVSGWLVCDTAGWRCWVIAPEEWAELPELGTPVVGPPSRFEYDDASVLAEASDLVELYGSDPASLRQAAAANKAEIARLGLASFDPPDMTFWDMVHDRLLKMAAEADGS